MKESQSHKQCIQTDNIQRLHKNNKKTQEQCFHSRALFNLLKKGKKNRLIKSRFVYFLYFVLKHFLYKEVSFRNVVCNERKIHDRMCRISSCCSHDLSNHTHHPLEELF